MDLELTGKRALVLAASRGLGRGIAEALAAEGAHVVLAGRSTDTLAAACEAINAKDGGRADYVAADLAAEGVVDHLHGEARRLLGGIDVLVANTGGPPPGPAAGMDAATLATQFHMMVQRVIDLANRVLPDMRAAGWGRILTVGSSGVIQPIPNLALSNTLRSALVGWSKTLATEVAGDGVTVNMLLPGRIHTDRVDQLDAAAAERQGKSVAEVAEAARTAIPAQRYGTVAEFANAAAFLCSGPASYVTGSLVRCDGGATKSV